MKRRGAVAIGYSEGTNDAPQILAKGHGYISDEIIAIGKQNGVMIREDELLMESLSRLEVGENIPAKMYQVIAELLAWVYKVEKIPPGEVMIKGLYQSGRSLQGKMQGLQVVANNLANINTTGFKREQEFSEILNTEASKASKAKGTNSRIRQVTDFTQGELALTSNPLDVGISGKGFFVVSKGDAKEFTRNGRFKIDTEGFLVTQSGDKVMGKSGEINLGEVMDESRDKITITKSGEIRIGEKVVDSLLVTNVNDSWKSQRSSGSNFVSEDEEYKPAEETDYRIEQGYLEESNVNPIVEMESMITMNKDYESSKKMINAFDLSLAQANEIGKV